jgi:hypothetical protein
MFPNAGPGLGEGDGDGEGVVTDFGGAGDGETSAAT